jgi:hypothetical protein
VFELTSHDTDGAYTLFDMFVEPGGAVASAHVHPHQTEIFTVLEGRLGVKRGIRRPSFPARCSGRRSATAQPTSASAVSPRPRERSLECVRPGVGSS